MIKTSVHIVAPLIDTGRTTSGDDPRRMLKSSDGLVLFMTADQMRQWAGVLTTAANDLAPKVRHEDNTLERRLIVNRDHVVHSVIVEIEPGHWVYEEGDMEADDDFLEARNTTGFRNEIVMLLDLKEGTK